MSIPKGYIPNQHGAWAMLVVPFLFGVFASGPKPIHLLLFGVWLLIYLTMFPLLLWVRTGRTSTYRPPVLFYSAFLIPMAIALVVWQPGLLAFAPWFLPLFVVNAYYASKNRERALLNDTAAVIQFSLIIFVAYAAGEGHVHGGVWPLHAGTDWSLAYELFGVSFMYFMGTVFYVKTMIREKGNRRFYALSIVVHAGVAALSAVLLKPALLLAFVLLLLRAVVLPKCKLTVKQSGILEIVFAAVVTVVAALVYAS